MENMFLLLNLRERRCCELLSSVVILDADVAVADEYWCARGELVDKEELLLLLLDWVDDDRN